MDGTGPSFGDMVAALEQAVTFGIRPSLDGIRCLTDALARPQDAFRVVQVTGTNGKTSVTRATAAILSGEGLETGSYTSPHLQSYTERIEVGGRPVSEEEFARALEAVLRTSRGTEGGESGFTEFELLTAAALWLFRERSVDVACLEVGMGGRWDATSVATPSVAVVTGVGLDHTDRLGSTLEAIAFDKSHIIKRGSSAVLGEGTLPVAEIFLERAEGVGAGVTYVTDAGGRSVVAEESTVRYRVSSRPDRPGGLLALDVRGLYAVYPEIRLRAPSYQAANLAAAVAAAECELGRGLKVPALRTALQEIRFPGRFEVIEDQPPIVLDGAHNQPAALVLASAIEEAWPEPASRPLCLLGVLADKDADGIARALAGVVGGFVVTQPDSPRALPAANLARTVKAAGAPVEALEPFLPRALELTREAAGPTGFVVTGSLYTVGQARAYMCR